MDCTANEHYSSFDCAHCLIDALIRCKSQNSEAYKKWIEQIRENNPDMHSKIRDLLND